MAAAYNLRQFSEKNPHGKLEAMRMSHSSSSPFPLDTVKAQECRRRQAEAQLAFARMKWDELGIEKAALKREKKLQEKEREKRLADREERLERIRKEEVLKIKMMKEKEERIRRDNEDRARAAHEAREQKRLEEEERERQRRAPRPCKRCSSTANPGKCPECAGKGYHLGVFLVPKVTEETRLEFGRKDQGCEGCGGYHFGILGEVKLGSGICVDCGGHGQIWPNLEDTPTVVDDKPAAVAVPDQSSAVAASPETSPDQTFVTSDI